MKQELIPIWERQLLIIEKSARKLVQALSKRMLDEYSAEVQAAVTKLKAELATMTKLR